MLDRAFAKDVVAGVAGLAISIAFFVMSFGNSNGAEMFPRLISVLMMACSATLLVRGLFRPGPEQRLPRDAAMRIGAAIVLTVLYIAALKPVGYLVSGLLFVPATAFAMGLRNTITIVAATVIYVVALYLLFTMVFHTPLPAGFLPAFV